MSTYEKMIPDLAKELGEAEAAQLVKLAKNYDNYIKRFKNKVDKLLLKRGLEVRTGLVFSPPKGDK